MDKLPQIQQYNEDEYRFENANLLKELIESFFKELSASIFNKLESVKANMITKALTISNLNGQIVSMYNTLSGNEIVKRILADSSKPLADKYSQIKELCSSVQIINSDNQQAIKGVLEMAEIFERAKDFKTPKLIKEKILQQIEKIGLFLIDDIEKLSEKNQESGKHSEGNQTVQNLMKLVKNKFNGISEESCTKFEEQLNRMASTLTSLEVPIPGSKYEHLQSLPENQINEIEKLAEQLAKLNKEGGNEQLDIEKMGSLKSNELFQLICNKSNFCSPEYLQETYFAFKAIKGVLGLFHNCTLNVITEEQRKFNHLNQNQLNNLLKLAAKVYQLTECYGEDYMLSTNPHKYFQTNSADLMNHLQNSKFGNQLIGKLLVDYPIFELLNEINK